MPRKANAEPRVRICGDIPFTVRQAIVARTQVEDTSIANLMEEAFRLLLAQREGK